MGRGRTSYADIMLCLGVSDEMHCWRHIEEVS